MNDLDHVFRFEMNGSVFCPGDDLGISLDGNWSVQPQMLEEAGYGCLVRDLVGLAVYGQSHADAG